MIRKSVFSMVFLALVAAGAWLIVGRMPTSFVPEEDQGYVMVRLQLPQAASLQRTSEAASKAEDILLHTPGVESVATISGVDLISSTQNTYTSILFGKLRHWDTRHAASLQAAAIQNQLNQSFSKVQAGVAFAIAPPAIPGVGSSGGVSFVLEDRSGKGGEFLAGNTDTFLAAARKRPEIASVFTTFVPHVPAALRRRR